MYIENKAELNVSILEKQWWYYSREIYVAYIQNIICTITICTIQLTWLFHLYMYFLLSMHELWITLTFSDGLSLRTQAYRPGYHYCHDWKYQQST